VESFEKYLSIPIINGLSPSSHPTQVCQMFYSRRNKEDTYF